MTIETGLALPGIRVEWADVVISGTRYSLSIDHISWIRDPDNKEGTHYDTGSSVHTGVLVGGMADGSILVQEDETGILYTVKSGCVRAIKDAEG